MDLKTYLAKKEEAKTIIEPMREYCLKCFRPKQSCFCQTIQSFNTVVAFRLLMHPMEARKEPLGTGRLTKIALKNCEIIVDATFDDNPLVKDLIFGDKYFPMLLYPGPKSINLSRESISMDFFQGKIPLVFVLDGTWPCAKSMMRDSKILHDLPRISFDSNIESKFSIKQQPQKNCVSTIESIYYLLDCLEKSGIENTRGQKEELLVALQKLVDSQIACASGNVAGRNRSRSNSLKGYKPASERKQSKKWEKRKVCFEY